MPTVREINALFDSIAPYDVSFKAIDIDNIGLIVEPIQDVPVTKVLCALDIMSDVIKEAAEWGAELIVTHHPVIFRPTQSVLPNEYVGSRVINLVKHRIAHIALHTNFDIAKGGVCDLLLAHCGAEYEKTLTTLGYDKEGKPWGLTRIGSLPEAMEMKDYLPFIKERLDVKGLRYYDSGRPVKRIACAGGQCNPAEVELSFKDGADTYVAGDMLYDTFLMARELGMNVIDASHFSTENVIIPRFKEILDESYPELEVRISKVHGETARFFV